MPVAFQLLTSTRINGVFQGLLDPRTLPPDLVWTRRIPDVPADDSEIMARFIGYIQIADLVADDQKAATYSFGKFQFESTNIPNLKIGANLTQAMINQLQSIQRNGAVTNDRVGVTMFDQALARLLLNIRIGIALRAESLRIAMLVDGFSYDRLGIKLTNVTWGMPADLKVTVAIGWENAATATPVEDILTVQQTGRVRYGITYNRISMSTPAFRLMIATTEFQNKARMFLAPNVSYANLSLTDLDFQRRIAQQVLGMEIEFQDARATTQAPDGTITQSPLWPLNKVVLTSTANDGTGMAMDFANGIVTESIVSGVIGGPVEGGPQFGPIAYPTGDQSLDPPQITCFGVQRGFSRKHLPQANACLTVGTVTETVSTAAPF